MFLMFSPRRVRIVLIRVGLSATAAAIASSIFSPGMNFETDRRTKPVRIAFSRIQAFVEAHRRAFLITDMGCGPWVICYWLFVICYFKPDHADSAERQASPQITNHQSQMLINGALAVGPASVAAAGRRRGERFQDSPMTRVTRHLVGFPCLDAHRVGIHGH